MSHSRLLRVAAELCAHRAVLPAGPSSPVRPEEVDRTLQRQDSGVESALLYAKSWSKYTKELLSWVEKRLNAGRSEIDSDTQ